MSIERAMASAKTPSDTDLREPYIEALLEQIGITGFEKTTMTDNNRIGYRFTTHQLFSLVSASDDKKKRAAESALAGLNHHRANFEMPAVSWDDLMWDRNIEDDA